MAKKRKTPDQVDVSDLALAPMPPFEWPESITVLTAEDITQQHDILWHLHDNFDDEARAVFVEVLHMAINMYCCYPVIKTIGDLGKYSKADQAEIWRRALYIVGYKV